MAKDRLAQRDGFLQIDVLVHRCIFAIIKLDDARDLDEVHACRRAESAGDRRTRDDQDRQLLVTMDEEIGDEGQAKGGDGGKKKRLLVQPRDPKSIQIAALDSACIEYTTPRQVRWGQTPKSQ